MFSPDLAYTIEAAFREAHSRGHAFFCVEHVLFALLFDDRVIEIIRKCGGSIQTLRRDLEEFFAANVEKVPALPAGGQGGNDLVEHSPAQTPAVQRVLRQAVMHVSSAGKDLVKSEDMLVAMFSEKDSHAVFFLKKQGIDKLDVINFVSHGITKLPPPEANPDKSDARQPEMADDDESDGENITSGFLQKFAEDLTEEARQGKLDPIIGRAVEIDRALRVLSRRQKNNPIFVGDPGVGKTALGSALAQQIVAGRVPESLKDAKLFLLNMGSVVAGTKFRGEFESRMKGIIQEASAIHNAILFIDELQTIVGAGATGSGSLDAANLLKPALASGKLRIIGSATHEDYKKSIEKDRALSRRFSLIEIKEPDIAETIEILKGLRATFEKHHHVKYADAALKAAAELSQKHINDRFLPDKAIDVLDEAGAANSLLDNAKRKKTISSAEIEQIVSGIARVPVRSVSSSDESLLKNLATDIKKRLFGQDPAVDAVSLAIKRSRAGLKAEGKPVGCFLFAGPTGVGKTELAKALADQLGVQFHRFDMSEYMEKHSVARLIGAPPGYVGYEEGGLLTDLVRKYPYAVLLLDEIEKAHEDLFNILLQVMDEASLTDSHGKKADFRNVILIMTTNAGSEKAASIGFGKLQADSGRESAVKKLFKPEFRNRLDDIVYFVPLSVDVIKLVVDKFVRELEAQLKARKITFALSDEARTWFAEHGFDPQLGARPMARLIQTELKNPLTEEILFGRLKKGGHVGVAIEAGRLVFSF